MKTCPKCAEEVQDDAKVCRYCGHKFGLPQIGCLGVGLAVVVAIFLIGFFTEDETEAPKSAPLSAERVAECGRLLKEGADAGLIRERPSVDRINVDDFEWARLPAGAKQGVLAALSCEAYQGKPLETTDFVVAYGFRSGKRVAMYSATGASYE